MGYISSSLEREEGGGGGLHFSVRTGEKSTGKNNLILSAGTQAITSPKRDKQSLLM